MRALLLVLLLAGCRRPAQPLPELHDGPAGAATSSPGAPPAVIPTTPAPTAPAPSPDRPLPSTGGRVGGPVSAEQLAPALGRYRDGEGHPLLLKSVDRAELDGREVAMMARWCGRGAETLLCVQLDAPAASGQGRLTLVGEPRGAWVEAQVGEGYAVGPPVSDGQVFLPLGAPPAPEDVGVDRRLQLGLDGGPLYCAAGGVAGAACEGPFYRVPLLPLHGRAIEERQLVLVGPSTATGCDPGARVDMELGPVDRIDLGRTVTPVEPREDHVRAIARITGIPQPQVALAAWVDLDRDRREELLFELNAPADERGRPGYSVVGWLDGQGLEPVLLEVHHGVSVDAPPPRHRPVGLVDLSGAGHLSVLVEIEGGGWVVWGKAQGQAARQAQGRCR